MPPSPAMRISPLGELRAENHKRGRSLESGILFREKDDDLALFNEVQNKERDNFLLQSNDEFDDIFCKFSHSVSAFRLACRYLSFMALTATKLRYFSDYKLGISIPARGESSDLLNADGDKNDYDWLITPPETPLFTSLDDEAPAVSLAPRGRPRSQPVTISRSSTMEKGYRSARSSASPHRLSPSPRSGNNSTLPSRSRPFSATHSSPPPTLRHSSPSRRLSPPPTKPTPAPRSNTPTPRRMSTGSAGANAQPRARGTSPVNTSRGNSASPKIRAWQSNIPGFSSEAPPNLRTSLADRPASYVRGSSPASSRNGVRSGRQSMSPTASRSVSSSHSHERDQFSSHSKGSVASSGDDDVDSLQSNPVNADRSVPRSVGSYPNNRATGLSKKPTKILSSSAPKRSFDLALRQMVEYLPRDKVESLFGWVSCVLCCLTFHRVSIQLSATTLSLVISQIISMSIMFMTSMFYLPNVTEERKGPQNMFRPLLSSVPSSTFYVGKSSAHHRALTSRNSSITTSSNASSDQGTSGARDTEESEQNQEDATSDFVKVQYPTVHDEVFVMDQADASNEAVENRTIEESPGCQHEENNEPSAVISRLDRESDADVTPDMELCSKCSRRYHSSELVRERDLWLCLECNSSELNSTTTIIPVKSVTVDKNTTGDFVQILECGSLEVFDRSASIPESLQATCTGETGADHLDSIAHEGQHYFNMPSKDLSVSLIEINQSVDGDTGHQELQQSGFCSNSKVDVSEGTGISLLLKGSTSGKAHLVQSRSFTASNISYDDFSYARDSVNSMRSSIGHSSASVSSSVDLGSSRQTETRIHWQSSGRKPDMENHRYESPIKHKRSISSLSGVPSITPSCLGDSFELTAVNKDKDIGGVTCVASECTDVESTCTDIESSIIFKTAAELSNHSINVYSGDTSVMSILTSEGPSSHENGDNLTNNSSNSIIEEISAEHVQISTPGDDAMQSSCVDRVDIAEVPHPSSLDAISEIEIENADILSDDSQSDVDSTTSKSCTNELLERSVSSAHNDVVTTAVEEFDISVPVNGVLESTVLLEEHGGTKLRSLTLEEATDAILFCSSIVHNLAYEAANIAIGKENSPVDVLRPTVTFVGKPNSDRRDIRSRTMGRRSSKSQKARQRKLETDIKPPSESVTAETDEKPTQRIVRSPSKCDSMNPPKLESKCNCTIM
ncbi:hypothetical protein DH2020_003736 [Rehmannia glutinosa]|uniref:Uncharacterized protein n=1 Tax=Rehmannia glutinosa TaxID=99300 RepID=A0ABR0XMM5_REHGL